MHPPLEVIDGNSLFFPVQLSERLGKDAPVRLWGVGRAELLSVPKTALFCSKSCPGHAILKAMDQAQEWRDQGRCVISGFHRTEGLELGGLL